MNSLLWNVFCQCLQWRHTKQIYFDIEKMFMGYVVQKVSLQSQAKRTHVFYFPSSLIVIVGNWVVLFEDNNKYEYDRDFLLSFLHLNEMFLKKTNVNILLLFLFFVALCSCIVDSVCVSLMLMVLLLFSLLVLRCLRLCFHRCRGCCWCTSIPSSSSFMLFFPPFPLINFNYHCYGLQKR